MATNVNSSTSRYTCRYCNFPMAYAMTPAGELAYECTNRGCQFTAMVGCECSMNGTHQAPTPTLTTPAQRKAAYSAAQGVKPVPTTNGYLVPSSSRGTVVHFVGADGRCSCEAGQSGKACWHVALVQMDAAA